MTAKTLFHQTRVLLLRVDFRVTAATNEKIRLYSAQDRFPLAIYHCTLNPYLYTTCPASQMQQNSCTPMVRSMYALFLRYNTIRKIVVDLCWVAGIYLRYVR